MKKDNKCYAVIKNLKVSILKYNTKHETNMFDNKLKLIT